MAVGLEERKKFQQFSMIIRLADEVEADVRKLSVQDRRFVQLVPEVQYLADAIKEWATDELKAFKDDPTQTRFVDRDGYQVFENPGLPQYQSKANDAAVRSAMAATDEYEQQRDIGRRISERYNPHYRKTH